MHAALEELGGLPRRSARMTDEEYRAFLLNVPRRRSFVDKHTGEVMHVSEDGEILVEGELDVLAVGSHSHSGVLHDQRPVKVRPVQVHTQHFNRHDWAELARAWRDKFPEVRYSHVVASPRASHLADMLVRWKRPSAKRMLLVDTEFAGWDKFADMHDMCADLNSRRSPSDDPYPLVDPIHAAIFLAVPSWVAETEKVKWVFELHPLKQPVTPRELRDPF